MEIKLIKELNTTNDKYGYNILQGGNTGENPDLKYPVVQFDLHFNYIKKYDSITDAGYKNNIDKSHISQACKHEQYQSGGFIWLFEKDYLFGNYDKEEILYSLNKEFKHPNARPVVQCDLKMNFIAKFGSICEAARDTGVRRNGINDNCTHRIKTSGGYIWMYEDEYEKYKLGLITVDLSSKRNKNPVIQFDKDMNIIAKFLSILDASKATKIDRKSINYACNGKYKHAGGYIWRYASDCQDLITYEQIA